MNEEDTRDEFADEEILFRRDGTIVWKVDGQRSVLRRPKFKELRVLREEIADLADLSRREREELQERARELTGGLQAELESLDAEELGEAAAARQMARLQEQLAEVRGSEEWTTVQAALRKQRNDSDEQLLRWFADSILARFGKPVPHVDDPAELPPWCIDQKFIGDVLDHWSSVPRRPGVV